MLSAKPPLDRKNQKRASKLNSRKDTPDNFYWREKSVVTSVRDQSSCAYCWAFSAIQAQESTHAIATGELLELSESNSIDCCDNECKGCNGGWPNKALEFVIQQQNGRLNLLNEYAYYPMERTCEFDQHNKVSHISEVITQMYLI